MAGTQISTSVTIISSLLGYKAITLSGMDSISAPTIMAGSKVEIASAFFTFGTDTDPQATTWTAVTTATTAYLTLTPSGTAGSQELTAKWSSTAPTWSTAKQGWYASAGSSVRYIGGCYKAATASYYGKWLYDNTQSRALSTQVKSALDAHVANVQTAIKVYNIGEWNMQATTTVSVIMSIPRNRIVSMEAYIINDAGTLVYPFHVHGYGLTSSVSSGFMVAGADFIGLYRDPDGYFNTTSYDATASTVANRGYVTVTYMVDYP